MEEITLTLGDDTAHPLKMGIPRENEPHVFTFEPKELSSITLRASKFKVVRPGPMGWDTVEICRKLSDSFRRKVVPLTRPAGIVKFPMARGGILLNMMPLGDPSANRALRQLLHNLGVSVGQPGKSGADGPIPGLDLEEDEGLDEF